MSRLRSVPANQSEESGQSVSPAGQGETMSVVVPDECSDCSGRVVKSGSDELVCQDCGMIVQQDRIDRGPDWRQAESGEESLSRVGTAFTHRKHDHGLSTVIGRGNRDGKGQRLGQSQARKMSRLREREKWWNTSDSTDLTLKRGLAEVERMGSALGLSDSVRETASVVYRRALTESIHVGRSIEGVATAAVYVGARQMQTPRSPSKVSTVSRVSHTRWLRTYRALSAKLQLKVDPATPQDFVHRIVVGVAEIHLEKETVQDWDATRPSTSYDGRDVPEPRSPVEPRGDEWSVKTRVERAAMDILSQATADGYHSGKSPRGVAAGAVYLAGLAEDIPLLQAEIAEATDLSSATISEHYRGLADTADISVSSSPQH